MPPGKMPPEKKARRKGPEHGEGPSVADAPPPQSADVAPAPAPALLPAMMPPAVLPPVPAADPGAEAQATGSSSAAQMAGIAQGSSLTLAPLVGLTTGVQGTGSSQQDAGASAALVTGSAPRGGSAEPPRFSADSSAIGVSTVVVGRVISHLTESENVGGKIKLSSKLHVGKDRVKAALTDKGGVVGTVGKKQGSHTTSYETILQLICTVCTDTDIKAVPEKIIKIAAKILDDEEMKKFLNGFDKVAQDLDEKLKTIPTKNQRKATTTMYRRMAAHPDIMLPTDDDKVLFREMLGMPEGIEITLANAEPRIEVHKAALKRADMDVRSEFIDEAATLLLRNLNVCRNAAYAGDGPGVGEGQRVKDANYALKALQRSEELSKMFDGNMVIRTDVNADQRKKLAEFVDDYAKPKSKLKSGLRELNLNGNEPLDEVRFLDTDDIDTRAGKIIERYRQVVELDTPGRPPRDARNWYPKTFAERIAQQLGNLFDFEKIDHDSDDKPGKNLQDTVARHLEISFSAFDLDKLPKEVQDKVLDVFIDRVILGEKITTPVVGRETPKVIANGQNWKDYSNDDGEGIDRGDLKSEIQAIRQKSADRAQAIIDARRAALTPSTAPAVIAGASLQAVTAVGFAAAAAGASGGTKVGSRGAD